MAQEVDAYAYENSKGQTYYLHTMRVTLKGGYTRDIYYFAKAVNPERALDQVPEGFIVVENKRTGFPMCKKAVKAE